MTADTTTEVVTDEQLQQLVNDSRLECEVVWECPEHGREECHARARWIAMWADGDHSLVCDDCHDVMADAPPENMVRTVVEWRPL